MRRMWCSRDAIQVMALCCSVADHATALMQSPDSVWTGPDHAAMLLPCRYVRKHIGSAMSLRMTPEIRFLKDEFIQRGEQVSQQLSNARLACRQMQSCLTEQTFTLICKVTTVALNHRLCPDPFVPICLLGCIMSSAEPSVQGQLAE